MLYSGVIEMFEDEFPIRLAKLRTKKGVSAREMSLSIGQNAGYISNVESGKALPSMAAFFFICEYLEITPKDFFDTEAQNPEKLNTLMGALKKLSDKQLDNLHSIITDMIQ